MHTTRAAVAGLALLAFALAPAGSETPAPLTKLPPYMCVLVDWGVRPEWSRDGSSILFMERGLGDAYAVDVKTGAIRIKDTRSLWGSCTAEGELSFSWRVILAPPHVLDYLAAHEVAHLREMNHSIRFWRLVRETCPRMDEGRRWLKLHGAGLHSYGVE